MRFPWNAADIEILAQRILLLYEQRRLLNLTDGVVVFISNAKSSFGRVPYPSVITTVTPRAACAPITRACSMSAVLDGPDIKVPSPVAGISILA